MIHLDRLERAEALAAIKTGLDQIKRGEKIPIEEAEGRLRKKHGFRPHE
jgi:predicted transcriptional regulator